MKALNKIKYRYREIKRHPITKDRKFKAFYSYVYFNILNRIKSQFIYTWIGGLKFIASKGDAGIVGNIYFGLHEFNDSMLILHYLREDDVFLDVGANVGHYSLLASGVKNCKSIAIEPVPKTFNQFVKHIALNNLKTKIKALNIGLSDVPSELYFSIDRSTMNRVVTKEYVNSIKIPVSTIDTVAFNENINLIKIDVEGYERYVLQGALKVLENRHLKVLIIEINSSGENYGIENVEILNILADYNFKPYSYNPINRCLTKLSGYNTTEFNTIFVRDFDFVRDRLLKSAKITIWDKDI